MKLKNKNIGCREKRLFWIIPEKSFWYSLVGYFCDVFSRFLNKFDNKSSFDN